MAYNEKWPLLKNCSDHMVTTEKERSFSAVTQLWAPVGVCSSSGHEKVICLEINPEEYVAWCKEQDSSLDSHSRIGFATRNHRFRKIMRLVVDILKNRLVTGEVAWDSTGEKA